MNSFDLTFESVTPMFLGGPVRLGGPAKSLPACQPSTQFIPSLRGALRASFRMLVAGSFDDPANLLEYENRFFGSPAVEDRGGQSLLRFRLTTIPKVTRIGTELPAWLKAPQGRWIGYLLGQGCFDPRHGGTLLRDYIDAGQKCGVRVSVYGSDLDTSLVVLAGALWALQRYSGLGGRSRKGFGTIRLIDPGTTAWPDREHRWLMDPFIEAKRKDVVDAVRSALDRPPTARPARPTASPMLDDGCVTEKSWMPPAGQPADWVDALATMGEQWRLMRAVIPATEVHYSPKFKTKEWLDIVSKPNVRDVELPLAALGLPIAFKKNVIASVYVDNGKDTEERRLPSPVVFRSFATQGGRVGVKVTGFHTAPLPPHGQIRIADYRERTPRPMTLDPHAAVAKVEQTVNQLVAACQQVLATRRS